ncbi:MAG: N-acetylmuramoyl-L-alanine amidase [candidate division NC10 bacterium CSP1-5]|nr:MAG: N-acetylmuramoyl-L-alanine amidase [candidate division NC10 bacterium CSP1-5]
MRKLSVILVGMMASLLLAHLAWPGEIEVLYEGQWKILKTELVSGREYVPLAQVAKITGGGVLRDGLRVNGVTFRLVEGEPGVVVGDTTFLLTAPPVKQRGAFWVPVEFLVRALEARYGEGRVFWNRSGRVVWLGKEQYNLRLLRHHAYPDYTRLVIEALTPLNFRLQEEGKAQLSLRIEGGILSPMLSEAVRINDGVVEMVEPTQGQGEAIFRIQRDAFGGLTRTFTLNNPERIVVDLYRVKTAAQPPPETPPAQPSSRAPSAAPATPQVTGLRTIAIDPGHGGRDTGAIGPKGLQEKDVVLDIGLKLRRLIQERLGIRVVMTRTEDVFVPLEERTAIANRAKADFFISVHVNAAHRTRAQGFETYFLSREPSDSAARASAIRENLSVNLGGLRPKEEDALRAILWDMANTLYLKESSELAQILLDELDKILQVDNRGVKSAPFFVLMGAAMPAVLLEVAFISNPQEEKNLQAEGYKDRVAEALYAGIVRFKDRYERRLGLVPSAPGRSVPTAKR